MGIVSSGRKGRAKAAYLCLGNNFPPGEVRGVLVYVQAHNTDENNVSPAFWRSFNKSLHSERKVSAPVRLPSPPMTHRLVIPSFTRLLAARSRPSRSRKSLHRALPITVPPFGKEVKSARQTTPPNLGATS